MSVRRMAVLAVFFLLLAVFANAASRSNMMQIKVLDSETRAVVVDDNGVPLNCEQLTFDAYCRSTKAPQMTNTLLVQEGNDPPFRVSCKTESKYSRCTPLPTGESFDAKREKHGITLYYVDDKGKAQKQFYALVAENAGPKPAASVAASATPAVPAAAAPRQSSAPATARPAAGSVQNSPSVAAPPPASGTEAVRAKVKCNFSSTPAGAEISVDWRYVGNTPSEISLSAGTHVVVISMPGFAEWKRELTVASDSVVNVTAVLERAQP